MISHATPTGQREVGSWQSAKRQIPDKVKTDFVSYNICIIFINKKWI